MIFPVRLRSVLCRILLVASTAAPWLMWLDLNAMALRFIQLRGHWPMCPSVLPCRSSGFYETDSIKALSGDPVHRLLDPFAWQESAVVLSALVWLLVWVVLRKDLAPRARYGLAAAFGLAWACLILDPTFAVGWYLD